MSRVAQVIIITFCGRMCRFRFVSLVYNAPVKMDNHLYSRSPQPSQSQDSSSLSSVYLRLHSFDDVSTEQASLFTPASFQQQSMAHQTSPAFSPPASQLPFFALPAPSLHSASPASGVFGLPSRSSSVDSARYDAARFHEVSLVVMCSAAY